MSESLEEVRIDLQTCRAIGDDKQDQPPKKATRSEDPAHVRPRRPPRRLPALADLRQEIDRIDEAMHRLLMERGRIIDRLIAVKKTGEFRLRLPAGPRGLDDAGPRRAAWRPAAPRHGRGHLAGDHRDLHLCAGALCGPCGHLGRRCADARFGAVPFRLHGALPHPSERRRGDRGGGGLARRSRHLPARPGRLERRLVADAGRPRQPQGHRAAALHRAARTIRPARRSS